MRKAAERGPFYMFEHGEFDITVLTDGYITVPIEIVLPEGTVEQRMEVLSLTSDADPANVALRGNLPLLRKGQDLILIDVGAGNKYQPTDGRLCASMEVAGVSPDSITKVAVTHAHPDHIWGMLTSGGLLRFPNATYFVAEAEWTFWMDPDYRTNLPNPFHVFAEGAQRDLNAIRDRVVIVKPGDEILSGMRVIGTPGHTPGHVSFELAGGDGLIITGDVATNEVSSFRYPRETFGFDAVSETAVHSRVELMRRSTSERIKLLGFHWTYPGVGFAEVDGDAYRFVPV